MTYALTHPGQIQGVVNLSGFLPNAQVVERNLEVLRDLPLFWAHGTQDPAVPFDLALRGWEAIREVGGRMEARDYRMGHWVSPEEMEDLGAWLAREIPDWPSG